MPHPCSRAARLAAAVVLALCARSAHAQIPEKFTNLQVMPKDVPRRQLVQSMREFASALGVRCSHCHKNTQPEDLATFDFAADDKEPKRIARAMMRMTAEINGRLLPEIGRTPTVSVKCITCHHGLARPEPLADVLGATLKEKGVEAALAQYSELREKYYGQAAYDFSMRSLNILAEQLDGERKSDDAIAVQEFNVKVNPGIANSHVLLGDLYLHKGDREKARAAFEKAVALEPGQAYYNQRLQELLASPSPPPPSSPSPSPR
jgi:tetratricopeptide (TPR) repeat protein